MVATVSQACQGPACSPTFVTLFYCTHYGAEVLIYIHVKKRGLELRQTPYATVLCSVVWETGSKEHSVLVPVVVCDGFSCN